MKFIDKIQQHMNHDVVYTAEDDRLSDVIFKMSKAGTDIAVVRYNEKIIGVITETDIYAALVKEIFAKIPQRINDFHVIEIMQGPPAKQVMASCETNGWHPCIDTFEDDTIENAIRIMQRSGLHHLLVFDKNNKLVGTLSSHDVIKSFFKNETKTKE